MQPFVTFIIGYGLKHIRINPAAVISPENLTHQPKIAFKAGTGIMKLTQKTAIQIMSNIQTQPVDVKLLYPAGNDIQQIAADFGVAEIELYQIVTAVPALIAKTVVIPVVIIKIQFEPRAVRRIFPIAANICKSPEIPPDMVKYAVEDNPDAPLVTETYQFF